jgi:hypothetical protein
MIMFFSQVISSLQESLILLAVKELIEFTRALKEDNDGTVIFNTIDHVHNLLVVVRCRNDMVVLYALFVDSEG